MYIPSIRILTFTFLCIFTFSFSIHTLQAKVKPILGGENLPKKVPFVPECSPSHLVRFMGVEPHTPLAVVDQGKIRPAGTKCCVPWAEKNSVWTAIDAQGQKVGTATLTGGSGYDVSKCYDYEFKTKHPKQPVLYLWQKELYQNPQKTNWNPTTEQQALLQPLQEKTLKQDGLWLQKHAHKKGVERVSWAPSSFACGVVGFDKPELPLRKQPWFFQVTQADQNHQYAITSGIRLRIYELTSKGSWKQVYASPQNVETLCSWTQPWAVFDMNQDGIPEVIFHNTDGPFWGDFVLQLNLKTNQWKQVAAGVFGSTA